MPQSDVILKEGFSVKKSGQRNLFGQYHWQKRWFVLVQQGTVVTLSYYEKKTDKTPKGHVRLSNKYITREPEAGEAEKPNLFAVGPLVEDGATRTYYISCESEDDKLEWMEVLNAAIEGASADSAIKRRSRASVKSMAHKKLNTKASSDLGAKEQMYMDPDWRKQQWIDLVTLSSRTDWKKQDVKDGVTVSRMGFNDSHHAIIKVEGIVRAKMRLVFGFLQSALQQGGKLDYLFRKEKLLERIPSKPSCSIVDVYHEIHSLPRTRLRYATLLKMMMPGHVTSDETCGLLIASVDHPNAAQQHMDGVRIALANSGCIIQPIHSAPSEGVTSSDRTSTAEDDGDVIDDDPRMTRVTFVMQVNLQGSLQRLLKGSYKSGLFVIGLRSFFINIQDHIHNYVKIVDI